MLVALRVAVSLAVVLGLLWYLQRRFARGAARKRDSEAITVVSRQGLGSKAHVVIVEADDMRYVLGVTEHRVEVLDRLPARPRPRPVDAPRERPAQKAVVFDDVLAASSSTVAADPVAATQRRVRHRSEPLRGSILSPDTWRQTSEAIRRMR